MKHLAQIACDHWQPGTCAAGHNGGRASVALCRACPHRTSAGALVAGAQTNAEAIPRSEWPLPVEAVAKLASDADAGVGSTIERLGVAFRIGPLYRAVWKALGGSCGCDRRKASLDAKYPYTRER